MILSDTEIARYQLDKALRLEPFRPEQLNPASYDLRLGSDLRIRKPYGTRLPLDLGNLEAEEGEYLVSFRMSEEAGYAIMPGEFILATTEEIVTLDRWLVGRIEGKSSLARVGLAVHVTGGFIDPGFHGQITLEMVNLFHRPLIIRPGMRIAQIAFCPVKGEVAHPYGDNGHYQSQMGPTLSRYKHDR